MTRRGQVGPGKAWQGKVWQGMDFNRETAWLLRITVLFETKLNWPRW